MKFENVNGRLDITFYKPQEAQKPFFKASARHIAYGGAAGGGKSWAMRMNFIFLALKYNNLKLLLLRRTIPELRRNHITQLYEEVVPCGLAKWNESKKVFSFINGSTIELGSCEHEKDANNYQGSEYEVIGLEEATHFTEYQKNILTSRARTTRIDFTPRCYYTANPGGVGHAWFKRLFIDREYKNNEKEEDYIFIPARVYDNKVLMENNPEYEENLKNLPEDLRKAFLEGNWDVFEGQYFSEWNRDKHVCEPFTIPRHWERVMAFDYGQDMTACYWGAFSPKGELFIKRKQYEPNLILSQAAKEILKAMPKDENIRLKVASPDLWNRRQERGVSGAQILYENGLKGLHKANDARVAGWRTLKEYLHYNKDDKKSMPRLRIFANCTNLIRSIPLLQYDKHNPEDVANEPHEITHAPEAIRYMVNTKVQTKAPIKKQTYPLGYLTQERYGESLLGFGG